MDINATLLAQIFSFMIFLRIVMKYVWPVYIDILDARKKIITRGISDAEKAEAKLLEVKIEAKAILEEAKKIKQDIIVQAERTINAKFLEVNKEITDKQKAAEASIEAERLSMEKKLYRKVRQDTVDLLMLVTSKLLNKTDLSKESMHLLNGLLDNKVGADD